MSHLWSWSAITTSFRAIILFSIFLWTKSGTRIQTAWWREFGIRIDSAITSLSNSRIREIRKSFETISLFAKNSNSPFEIKKVSVISWFESVPHQPLLIKNQSHITKTELERATRRASVRAVILSVISQRPVQVSNVLIVTRYPLPAWTCFDVFL